MAHLWVRDESSEWLVLALGAVSFDLDSLSPVANDTERSNATGSLLLPPAQGVDDSGWALVAERGRIIRVNGQPVISGIRALGDRDEIKMPGRGSVYFSTEKVAAVESFPSVDRPFSCPRCTQPIEEGDRVVRCPRCRVWHHHTEEFPCWDYSPVCGACGEQDTDLEAGYRWSPEEL